MDSGTAVDTEELRLLLLVPAARVGGLLEVLGFGRAEAPKITQTAPNQPLNQPKTSKS